MLSLEERGSCNHSIVTAQHRLSKLDPRWRPACLRGVRCPHRHEHTAGATSHPSLCQPGLQSQDWLAWLLLSLSSLYPPNLLPYVPTKMEHPSSLSVPPTALHFPLVQKTLSKYTQPGQFSCCPPYSATTYYGCQVPEGWGQTSLTSYPTWSLQHQGHSVTLIALNYRL